jgi:hypothetical protein
VVYLLGGFIFPGNYVLSTVVVVVLLAMDFWNCRVSGSHGPLYPFADLLLQNVSGRTLVGLRFWNQVRRRASLEYLTQCKSRLTMMENPTGFSRVVIPLALRTP